MKFTKWAATINKGVNLDNCPYHFFGNQRHNYLVWRAGWIAAQNEDIAANI